MKEIYNILTKNNVKWFADSGSLLGIIREGKFLDWDKGIDLSAVIDDIEDINNVSKAVIQIQQLGFYVAQFSWNGCIYKYVLSTKDEKKYPYNVDLHLFVKKGDMYVCPQISPKENVDFITQIKNMFLSVKKGYPIEKKNNVISIIKYYIKKTYQFFVWRRTNVINMRQHAVSGNANTYYWTIPDRYLESTVLLIGTDLYGPSGYLDYLSYRYGNWKVPNKEWVFLRDDHSIKVSSIDEIDNIISLYPLTKK